MLPSNIKLIAMLVAAVVIFAAGWTTHSWYVAAQLEAQKDKIIAKLGEGQGKIIDFNQKFDKEVANAKDDCINRDIPPGVLRLLQ